MQSSQQHNIDAPTVSPFVPLKDACKDSDDINRSQRALIWNTVATIHANRFELEIKKMEICSALYGVLDLDDMLGLFRFPMVTYLTCTTFHEIAAGLRGVRQLLESGLADDLDLQYAADFLRVVCANFKAVS